MEEEMPVSCALARNMSATPQPLDRPCPAANASANVSALRLSKPCPVKRWGGRKGVVVRTGTGNDAGMQVGATAGGGP